MKKQQFAEEYAQEKALEAQFKEAEKAGNKEQQEALRNAYHTLGEQIAAKGKDYAKLYQLYCEAQNRGNQYIDLSDTIWDDQVEPLINSFREYGIWAFTFSSTWSSAVETAWLFTQNGCKLEGLIEINGCSKAFMSDEYEKAHGYLFSTGTAEE